MLFVTGEAWAKHGKLKQGLTALRTENEELRNQLELARLALVNATTEDKYEVVTTASYVGCAQEGER